jgi:D-alanine-D-alanine ligase-like ATP-grasp enzyme
MRICVLSDEEIEDFNPAPFLEGYDWEMVTLSAPVLEMIRKLAESGKYDVFLNVCEGYEFEGYDENEEFDEGHYHGIEVVEALEKLNLPFTGAGSNCFDPTREEMQSVADAKGIGFAKGYQVKSAEEAEGLVKNLRYPIMVKHPKSYGSTGMFKESRADRLEQVLVQVKRVCSEFGAARMEEFIVGKEYNVLVVDNPADLNQPYAYPPAELVFPPGEEFWHTDIKWDYNVPFDFKEVTDRELIARLHDTAVRMYLAMGITGYGRCDIRMNENGELFILEINPNPAIMLHPKEYGPADYIILYDKERYKGFFDRILEAALVRHRLRMIGD